MSEKGRVLGIYGAGGMGREVLELALLINQSERKWDRIIFIDDGAVEPVISGIKVFNFDDAMAEFGMYMETSVAVGEPLTREKLFAKLADYHIPSATLIYPDIHIPDTTQIGDGVVIQYGSFISCNVKLENGVYIQPCASIGHDCVIGEGSMISTGCVLAGGVEVGAYAYIGMGGIIKEFVNVGKYTVIGMASAVYKDIGDEIIAMGSPARPMKRNESKRVFKS